MAGRVINLRTRRKQKARDEKRERPPKEAPGVTKPVRQLARRNRELDEARLDGKRLDDDG